MLWNKVIIVLVYALTSSGHQVISWTNSEWKHVGWESEKNQNLNIYFWAINIFKYCHNYERYVIRWFRLMVHEYWCGFGLKIANSEIYNTLPSVRRWCPCSHSERMISITRRTIQRVHWSGVFRRRSSNGQVSPYRFSMVEGCLIIRLVYCHLEHLWLQLVSNGFTSGIK